MLAYIIWIIHFFLVISIIIAPFVHIIDYKKGILILLTFLLFQYLTGYEKCGLTQLEYFLMGENYKEGFLYRIINPIIKIPENYFNDWLYLIHIIYVLILIKQVYL